MCAWGHLKDQAALFIQAKGQMDHFTDLREYLTTTLGEANVDPLLCDFDGEQMSAFIKDTNESDVVGEFVKWFSKDAEFIQVKINEMKDACKHNIKLSGAVCGLVEMCVEEHLWPPVGLERY